MLSAEWTVVWNEITAGPSGTIIVFLSACCLASFITSVLAVLLATRLLRKNDALVELLLVDKDTHTKLLVDESNRHTTVVLSLSERLNSQYYMHQEKVSIEHIATLRELLSSLQALCSPANQTNPEDSPEDRKVG